MKICGLAADVDGTLTVSRRGFLLDLKLAEKLRLLEEKGVRVMLVSGNAAPVLAGIARYMGYRGPHVAENGCIVYSEDLGIIDVCKTSCREEALAVEERLRDIVKPSWQNMFRRFDYAFRVREGVDVRNVVTLVEKLLGERGSRCKVSYSGYAIHVRPLEASKGAGLREAIRLAGISPDCVIAVGDSEMDLEMGDAGVRLAAVANADETLRKRASILLRGESSRGVLELVEEVLREL